MRNIRLFTLAIALLCTYSVFAATEQNPVPSSSDVVITGTSYSIPSTYVAGAGTKVSPMATKGVKFRTNRNASGVTNGVEFTVTSGYTISSIEFCGTTNDNTATGSVTGVYIDGTDDAHKLANTPTVTIPNKKASSAATFTISGFSATQKVIVAFSGANQINLEYTVTYSTGGGSSEVAVTGVSLNKTSTTIDVGNSETLTATVSPSDATDKSLTWSTSNSAVATVNNGVVTAVAAGTATITATSVADNTKSDACTVTVPTPSSDPVAVTGVTLSKNATSLNVGATETLTANVQPSNATNKAVNWSSDDPAVATVSNGTITGVSAGTTRINVTTVDGNHTDFCTVAVSAVPTPPIPSTGLEIHMPGRYEADEFEDVNGYATPLTIYGNSEFEMFYITRDENSKFCVATTNADQTKGITTRNSDYDCNAADGWFHLSGTGWSSSSDAPGAEFAKMSRRLDMDSTCEFSMHIKGYNQLALVARDKKKDTSSGQTKPDDNRYLEVFIDGVKQPLQFDANPSIRRYDISSAEHVVRVKHYGKEKSAMYAFSLRVAQEPRTKYVDGNDSTQEVLQTTAPQPVYYYTKYNSLGETRLEWDGAQGTGFTLESAGSSKVGDTLALAGTAQCPVGEYHYFVKTYFNGVETSRVPGKIKVTSLIKAKGVTRCEAYQNEAIDDIRFTYYALSEDAITLSWENNKIPAGISGHGANGTYVITGTPTQVDTFVYTISVLGGNSISDTLFVDKLDLGNDPILYLYKNDGAKAKDGTYKYLTSAGGGNKNLVARKAKADGKRSADQYNKYKWILISEDVDADNEEVMAIARGEVALPVLNMKSFTYAPGRLNWGEPDNGSLTQEGRFVTVYRDDHPIFQALNKHKGDRIMVLDTVVGKGLMPIDVDYDNTLCLATALTRDINDYYGDGPERTIMHEVERLNGKKYICFPIGMEGSNHLTTDGKRLLEQTITYLLSSDATIKAPSLAITHFRVGSYDGVIDDENNVITLNVKEEDRELMKAAEPVITLADPMSFVTPNSGEAVNFIDAPYGIRYVVSDYVTKRNYNVTVRLYNPQGIDNIEVGTWLNIFDVYGRKVATTNQDIRTMDLPHGMYIIVTESGQTIKIMR